MENTELEWDSLIENREQCSHLAIDILEDLDLELAPECCIYKLPTRFREVMEKRYTPQMISIGPLHHGDKRLAKTERQKLRYHKKFCERTSKTSLGDFLSFIKQNADRIYRCYDELVFETEFDASKFVTM